MQLHVLRPFAASLGSRVAPAAMGLPHGHSTPSPGFRDNGRETLGEAAGSAPDHKKWVGGLGDTLAKAALISQSRKESKGGGLRGDIPMSPSTVLPLVK